MGIYRTILEEDLELGGVLDDNNSMDMAEIDQVVEDHDANEDEQVEAQAAEFGPTDDVDSIMDESAIAVAEADMNFNSIMMAIGIHEISEAAAGREVLYENALTDYLKKAKDWVVNFFKKVWSVLKRYAANIASVFHTNKGLAQKKGSEIKEGYKKYVEDKGENHLKIWKFNDAGIKTMLGKDFWSSRASAAKSFDIAAGSDNIDVEAKRKEFQTAILNEAGSGSNEPGDDFRGALKKKLYGGEEKTDGLVKGDDVVTILGSGEAIKNAKKAMDNAKKEYKSAIAKLNEAEKKATRASNKTNSDDKKTDGDRSAASETMNKAIKLTQIIKNQLSDLQVTRAVVLTAARAQMVQARALAHAYIAAYNKGKDKKYREGLKTEGFGFLSGVDLI